MYLERTITQPLPGSHATPVLLVHGAYAGAWVYKHWRTYFAERGYLVCSMSLRGHGASDGLSVLRAARMEDYVDDVAAVLVTLAAPAVLVGHGMGGALVLECAARHPEAVSAVALLAVAIPQARRAVDRLHLLRRLGPQTVAAIGRAQLAARLSGAWYEPYAHVERARRVFFSPILDAVLASSYAGQPQPESLVALSQLSSGAFRPRIAAVRASAIVIGAAGDALSHGAAVARTATILGTEARACHGGHLLMLDHGWAEGAAILLDELHKQGIPQPLSIPQRARRARAGVREERLVPHLGA